jgi:hypothetical protein
LTFAPYEVSQFSRWANALPSCACSTICSGARRRRGAWLCGTTGYRSGRTWKPLRRLTPTSLGFATSSSLRKPSDKREQAPDCHPEETRASTSCFSGLLDVTRCENPPPTEVGFGHSNGATQPVSVPNRRSVIRLRRYCPKTVEPYWLGSPSTLLSRGVHRNQP